MALPYQRLPTPMLVAARNISNQHIVDNDRLATIIKQHNYETSRYLLSTFTLRIDVIFASCSRDGRRAAVNTHRGDKPPQIWSNRMGRLFYGRCVFVGKKKQGPQHTGIEPGTCTCSLHAICQKSQISACARMQKKLSKFSYLSKFFNLDGILCNKKHIFAKFTYLPFFTL